LPSTRSIPRLSAATDNGGELDAPAPRSATPARSPWASGSRALQARRVPPERPPDRGRSRRLAMASPSPRWRLGCSGARATTPARLRCTPSGSRLRGPICPHGQPMAKPPHPYRKLKERRSVVGRFALASVRRAADNGFSDGGAEIAGRRGITAEGRALLGWPVRPTPARYDAVPIPKPGGLPGPSTLRFLRVLRDLSTYETSGKAVIPTLAMQADCYSTSPPASAVPNAAQRRAPGRCVQAQNDRPVALDEELAAIEAQAISRGDLRRRQPMSCAVRAEGQPSGSSQPSR
jgi:hypothetical protein